MEAVDKISVGVSKEKAGQNTQEAITENADGMKVSLGEKICYGVGDIGANLVWTNVNNARIPNASTKIPAVTIIQAKNLTVDIICFSPLSDF